MIKYEGKLPSPAVAVAPHDRVSNKYSFVSTKQAADIVERNGWKISRYAYNPLSRRNGYQRHALEFIPNENNKRLPAVGDEIPRILLINSHDATTGLKFESGFVRLVCTNGLVRPIGNNQNMSIRHTSIDEGEIGEVLENVITGLTQANKFLKDYKLIKLDENQVNLFARAAIQIRKRYYNSDLVLDSLLQIRRNEDNSNDLWTVFNRIQENCISGGAKQILSNSTPTIIKTRKTQPVANIKISTAFNKDLWHAMDKFAQGEPRRVSQIISVN